jgi:hypothetical protein
MPQGSESDVSADPVVARSRDSGGRAPDGERDMHSTTGTTHNETFVGRASGDESGAGEESGAEARAAGRDDDSQRGPGESG